MMPVSVGKKGNKEGNKEGKEGKENKVWSVFSFDIILFWHCLLNKYSIMYLKSLKTLLIK